MCGRFAIAMTLEEAEREFGIQKIYETFNPSYNVAPTQNIPIIWNEEGKVALDMYKWGLLPHWSKEEKTAYKMINTRVETLANKDTFDPELELGRCLIPATGFFEWDTNNSTKKPMYIFLKGKRNFAFAGISWKWEAPDGRIIKTCSIITTQPNRLVSRFHDRMPAILPKEMESKWINTEIKEKKEILSMISQNLEMEAYEVSQEVNFVKNNQPELIEPIK